MSSYEVGFGKPPKAAQFKKGTSGNPAGRPKGALNLASILDQLLQPVTVAKNGKATKMPAIKAVITKLLISALNGDHRSQKLVLDLFVKNNAKTVSGSISDLMGGQSPFDLSQEDFASIAKKKLLKGVS